MELLQVVCNGFTIFNSDTVAQVCATAQYWGPKPVRVAVSEGDLRVALGMLGKLAPGEQHIQIIDDGDGVWWCITVYPNSQWRNLF